MWPLDLRVLLGEVDAPLQPEQSQPKRQATISDWLELNGLTRKTVLQQLAKIEFAGRSSFIESSAQSQIFISGDEAWALCAASMRAMFAGLKPEIDNVEAETPKCLQPDGAKHPKPFTYDLGFQNLPFVSLHYRGRAADLLAMAHEFGHALQIVASWASGEGQMPPIARECCAFMAELALTQCCGDHIHDLKTAHGADDVIYLGENKVTLETALQNSQAPYRYDWNYPLARLLAARLSVGDQAGHACALYQAGRGSNHLLKSFMVAAEGEVLAA